MAGHTTNRVRANIGRRRQLAGSPQSAHCCLQLCAIAFAALLSLATEHPILVQAGVSVEYQVKAAFLFNFAKFVEWPSDAFPSEKAPINLCVFRHDPFGGTLDEIMKGKEVNNREVIARRTDELSGLKSCQLVFVSNTEDKRLSEVLDGLKGTSALVVGESEGFAERGGGIQFFQEDNKVRFAINVNAIQRAHLTVNSGLLALARIVHDSGQPKGN